MAQINHILLALLIFQWFTFTQKPPCRVALWINLLDIVTLFTLTGPLAVVIMLALGKRWKWMMTPDVDLPGDLTLPVVKAVHDVFGEFWCSVYWLGFRNRWHGLDFAFAQRLPKPWDPARLGYQSMYDDHWNKFWWERKPILGGKFQIKRGWRMYLVGGVPYGVPCCTITKA